MKKTFQFDSSFYDAEALKQAIDDFSDSYSITLIWKDELEIQAESEQEWEEVFSEFMNYVISL